MNWFHHLFPFMQWFPMRAATVRTDVVAGITVALVLIPQSMAYAQLAGLPSYYGLYAAFLPPMVAALFGSSCQLSTGPVAVVSLLTAAALEPIATIGGETFIAYAIILALIVGLFQLALGVLRLGVLVNFLSHPVVIGFTNAAAIIIATSQLSKIFGVSVEKMPLHYQTVWNTLQAAAIGTHWPTFFIALLAFSIMIVFRKLNPRLPNVLIAVTVTILISWALDYENLGSVRSEHTANSSVQGLLTTNLVLVNENDTSMMITGGKVVGAIPQGLPAFRLPDLSLDIFLQLLGSAVTISLIGFMEAISIAKAMAIRTGQRLDANQELIGQGLSNLVGSLFQSYPVSGSFSRSALNIGSGAITGFSSVIAGLAVIIALLWLTPLFYHLPQATLAAVIVVAVFGLINLRAFWRIWQVQHLDGVIAIVTFVLTLFFAPHLELAIIVGIILSMGLYLYRTHLSRRAS